MRERIAAIASRMATDPNCENRLLFLLIVNTIRRSMFRMKEPHSSPNSTEIVRDSKTR